MTNHPVARVSYRDSDHSYHLDGKRIPSVTTLLGNLSKPGLVYWSANEGAKAAAEVVREWGRQFGYAESPDPSHFEHMAVEVHDAAKYAHTIRKNKAAAKGNVVHAAIEQYHNDFFNATPPDADTEPAASAAWEAFLTWWGDAGLTCVATECTITDPAGRYAGRLDLLLEGLPAARQYDGVMNASLYVADIKTSNAPYAEHVLQNAGYAAAIEAQIGRPVAGTKVLWLPEGATTLTVIERDDAEWREDYRIFESLIDLHTHRKRLDAWLKEIKDTHGPSKDEA